MEYRKSYEIKRMMHVRPCAKVVKTVSDIYKKTDNSLKIFLYDKKEINPTSILDMVLSSESQLKKGSKIEVIVTGDFPRETLEKYADDVGLIFATEKEV